MASMSGYITPVVDSDSESGSEYCPSDESPRKGKRQKVEHGANSRAPSTRRRSPSNRRRRLVRSSASCESPVRSSASCESPPLANQAQLPQDEPSNFHLQQFQPTPSPQLSPCSNEDVNTFNDNGVNTFNDNGGHPFSNDYGLPPSVFQKPQGSKDITTTNNTFNTNINTNSSSDGTPLEYFQPSVFQNLQGENNINVGGLEMGMDMNMNMDMDMNMNMNMMNMGMMGMGIPMGMPFQPDGMLFPASWQQPGDQPGVTTEPCSMGTFLQTNAVTGGYGYDPELAEFEQFSRDLAAFALEDLELPDADMPMLGAASDAAPCVKTEPAMDNPFAITRDETPTFPFQANDSKPKTSSKANASTIPLICYLCEKQPRFSDVSHLLTHISSKGHLSQRFTLDLKAKTNKIVQQRIRQYDQWSEQNGIEDLLTTRQEAKELKKENQQKRQRGSGKDKKSRRNSSVQDAFKTELDVSPQMPPNALPASNFNPLNQVHRNRDDAYDNVYQTPSNKRSQSVYPEPDSPTVVPNDEPTKTGKQTVSRTPTLKGIRYHGMDVFDAGTPEMQRMRNQKKDPSVVVNMELVSRSITKDEHVWDSTMTVVERTRSVYDTPTDLSDELEGPADDEEDEPLPVPKKSRAQRAAPRAKPRPKPRALPKALPRIQDSPEPTAPTTKRLTRSAARAMRRGSTQSSRGGNQGGSKAQKFKEEEEDEEDWPFDQEARIPQRRLGLSVFQVDGQDDGSIGGGMLGGRQQVAQDFDANPFGSQQPSIQQRTAMQGLSTNRPLSSIYGRQPNQAFSVADKKNDRNVFSMQQSISNSMQPSFYPRQDMQSGGGFNPLCMQRPNPYGQTFSTGFDPSEPSNPPFQTLNGMGFDNLHGGMGGNIHVALNNELASGMTDGVANGLHNGLHNSLSNNNVMNSNNLPNSINATTTNMLNSMSNDDMPNSMGHSLDRASNDGSHYHQPGNNSHQNNGFNAQ